MRYLFSEIRSLLPRKMVFVGGPRQSGKTTLAKQFIQSEEAYLNWDFAPDREKILQGEIPLEHPILVFDEIHKFSRWRNWLKGYYDKFSTRVQFLVAGSARLDIYRRGGDSLQGRYRYLRLYPFSFKELAVDADDTVRDLLEFSGFPEPFFMKSTKEARLWSREYRSRMIRDDIVDLENIKDLGIFEKLLLILPERVASPLSVNSIREDLDLAHDTTSRWLDIYERLYGMFRLYPLQHRKLNSLKKEAKHYHFDWTLINDPGARLENLIAFHLLKHSHFAQDVLGEDIELFYFRDKEKREVDFVLTKDQKPIEFIEVKLSDTALSADLRYLKKKFPQVRAVQVVLNTDRHFESSGIEVMSARRFLGELAV